MDWNTFNNEVSSNILDSDRLNDLLSELGCDLDDTPGKSVFRGKCPVHGGNDHNFQLTIDGHSLPIRWKCYSHHCEELFKPSLLGLVRGVLTYQKGVNQPVPMQDTIAFLKKFVSEMPIRPARSVPIKPKPTPNLLCLSQAQVRARLQIPSPYYLMKGYSAEVLNAMDIGHSAKRNKTIVPFYNNAGICIGFSERSEKPACEECGRCHHSADECKYGQMKWILPEGFAKGLYLYNYAAVTGSNSDFVLLVEGPGDVLRAIEAGVPAVAALGCDLSAHQAKLLAALNRKILIAFDNDKAGLRGAKAAFGKLRTVTPWARPFRIPSGFKDLGEMTPESVKQWVETHP